MTRRDRTTFICIAGAFHSSWVWHRVLPLLQAAGHHALAPDLPGMGADRRLPVGDATLDIWADDMAGHVRAAGGPVILVGHSRGGLVMGEVAERVPDLLAGIIYVSALIVPPGRTAIDVMGLAAASATPTLTPDGKALVMDPERARLTMYQRCSLTDAQEFTARLDPEPLAPNATPASVTLARWGRVPRAYIETSDDRTLSLDHQRTMQAQAPCDPVLTLDTDHSPFVSAPTELAAALVSIAARFENATRKEQGEHR